MADPQKIFKAQAEWQKSLARLSWPEKVKLAEAMRPAILTLRKKTSLPPNKT